MKILNFIFRALRSIKRRTVNFVTQRITYILMKIFYVELGKGFRSKGVPIINVHRNSKFIVGKNFQINCTNISNLIGRGAPCIFRVDENALLKIGDNVGMSRTTIVSQKEIIISDNVRIGGNTCIYDSDFHSLTAEERIQIPENKSNVRKRSIYIGKNVFIGAHVTIFKGVKIGENSIIGACSVVAHSIPANEIWAGNPAKFIRKINDY